MKIIKKRGILIAIINTRISYKIKEIKILKLFKVNNEIIIFFKKIIISLNQIITLINKLLK